MEKDIVLLMTTQDRKAFDEQAKFWPGVENFAKYTHNCVCTDPDCLMKCIQSIGRWFPSRLVFAQFLEDVAKANSDEEVKRCMADYADRHPYFARNLELAYEQQQEQKNGVSQRFEDESKRTLH